MEGSMEDLAFKPAGAAMAALIAGLAVAPAVDLVAVAEQQADDLAAGLAQAGPAEPLGAKPQQLDLFQDVPLG
jgi:hypothetical protein